MTVISSIYLFVLGVAAGSFAYVLALRMHAGKDWVKSRSQCDHCSHTLQPRDLVPIASWLLSRGACRYCKASIGWSYPLIELLTGAAFVWSYLALPYELQGVAVVQFALWLVLLIVMAALMVQDLKWFLLPNKLVYSAGLIAIVHWVLLAVASDVSMATLVIRTLGAIALGGGIFMLLYVVSRGRWIGDGDIRLGVVMGLVLADPLHVWLAIFVASLGGSVLALPVALKRKQVQLKIPFGPFLIVGLFIAYLYAPQIIDLYTDLIL